MGPESVSCMSALTRDEGLVRPVDAARWLALSRRTLRRYEANGTLPPIKLNRRVIRYRRADVMRLLGKEDRP